MRGLPADGETSPARRATGREPGPDTRALAAAGRRVGLASVILALCVPLVVPGLHPSKLFSSGPGIGGDGGGSTGAAVALPDTLSQTMHELQQKNATKLLSYTLYGDQQLQRNPPYLQTYVYDTLTDSGWQTSSYTANDTRASTMPAPQGLNDMAAYRQFRISVNVRDHALTSRSVPSFLAVPYPATQVTTPPGVWLVDPELMVFSQNSSTDVQVYTATSVDVDPTAAQLRAAPRPPSSLAADLALPKSYEVKALKQIADEQTAGQTTEYDKVNALAAWLSGATFSYKASAPTVNSAASLLHFLTTSHAGVCVQSAWAMTVLTRLLGIPARMAGGFTGGSHRSGSTYTVTTDDAHVWAEVYFTGYGWMKFEATAGGGDGSARASSYQSGTPGGSYVGPPSTGQTEPTAAPAATSPLSGTGLRRPIPEGGGPGSALAAKSAGTPWAAVALAIIAAIALAGGVIAIVAPPAHRVLSAHPPDGPAAPGGTGR